MKIEDLERYFGVRFPEDAYSAEVRKKEKPEVKQKRAISKVGIREVKYSGPATIIFWDDDTKTVSKCAPEDNYDKTIGFLVAWGKKDGLKKTTLVEAMDRYVFNETAKDKEKEDAEDDEIDQLVDEIIELLSFVEGLYLLSRFLK